MNSTLALGLDRPSVSWGRMTMCEDPEAVRPDTPEEDTMSPQEPLGPCCQSCSMPLAKPEDFGTDRAGYRVNDYCYHCYQEGAFTDPEVTMEEMTNRCVAIMANRGIMPEAKVRALLTDVMPRLARWREGTSQGVFAAAGGRGFSAGDDQC